MIRERKKLIRDAPSAICFIPDSSFLVEEFIDIREIAPTIGVISRNDSINKNRARLWIN